MLSFFTILLILVGANAIFMVFSLSGISNARKKSNETKETVSKSGSSKVYPLQTLSSKFKKAV